ncbi:tetratricopeptide repeat protein [Oricola cellulosilytica]|uniref:Sel1 repeat family protein n=1 Tax=Oricola cellulosilytica TaxID=1429082 RepID=A0A4V2MND2_9HYPH|nr:tetratricopeptide repeat protein [Oricola cellulosilytica]TCD12340.1 sel1 repeat family protein [Oricola cellulosilytica]
MLSAVIAPMAAVAVAGIGVGAMTPVPALAQEVADAGPSSPWSRFRFGFSAYKNGRKDEALKAYRDAAEQGHAGARWKLATMYASGDGVREDDYQAYQLYEGLVNDGAVPGTGDETFVSSALFSLASYLRRGIPNSPITADPLRARQLYLQSASQFGDPNAQFEIGRMYLMGEGGAADALQAARWFKLAAQKGHVGAEAMLGKTLFDSGRTKQGLAILTSALFKAQGADLHWIRTLQEEAFALASEADRRSVVQAAN